MPARALYTALPDTITVTDGRPAHIEEALGGTEAVENLGLANATGGVTGDAFTGPVVGTFTADEPLGNLNTGLLVPTDPSTEHRMRSLYVVASSINDVAVLEDVVPGLMHMTDRTQLRIESPAVLADLQEVVAGQLGENTRRLMLGVLTAGLILIGVTLYGATAARRRDFGRRRALGATRSAIITLVLTQTAVAAISGAVIGTATGLAIVNVLEGNQPAPTFTVGVATLAVLAALLAAIPPALAAAYRDPVHILRVP